MTTERYIYLETQMENISTSRITDDEISEMQMQLFQDRKEFDDWNDIHNGITKPITKQDILEEMADEQYNSMKEGN